MKFRAKDVGGFFSDHPITLTLTSDNKGEANFLSLLGEHIGKKKCESDSYPDLQLIKTEEDGSGDEKETKLTFHYRPEPFII